MGVFDLFKKRDNALDSFNNKFNKVFFWGSNGGKLTPKEYNVKRYVEYAYNLNPDVYAVVNAICRKFSSIPFEIKEIDSDESYNKIKSLNQSTSFDYNAAQEVKSYRLTKEAFKDKPQEMPLLKPNEYQSWSDLFSLTEKFLTVTGNAYWYVMKSEIGAKKEPLKLYCLPSHLMDIVVKDNLSVIDSNVVDHYVLMEGDIYTEFNADEVIHIKYNTLDYNANGSHLFGESPMRSIYNVIDTSNNAVSLSNDMMRNGGSFGFIHAKDTQTPFTSEQAKGLKERMQKMAVSKENLGRIAGVSSAIGFTRISLTTDELKPFDFLKYTQKQVCNVLGWDDKLLNNDDGAKYDNLKTAEKRVVMGKIVPDINLIQAAFNEELLPMFKGYESKRISFKVKDLPEMQQDYKSNVEWVEKAIKIGLITRNEGLTILGMPTKENPLMDEITVENELMTLQDALYIQDENL